MTANGRTMERFPECNQLYEPIKSLKALHGRGISDPQQYARAFPAVADIRIAGTTRFRTGMIHPDRWFRIKVIVIFARVRRYKRRVFHLRFISPFSSTPYPHTTAPPPRHPFHVPFFQNRISSERTMHRSNNVNHQPSLPPRSFSYSTTTTMNSWKSMFTRCVDKRCEKGRKKKNVFFQHEHRTRKKSTNVYIKEYETLSSSNNQKYYNIITDFPRISLSLTNNYYFAFCIVFWYANRSTTLKCFFLPRNNYLHLFIPPPRFLVSHNSCPKLLPLSRVWQCMYFATRRA